MREIPRAPPRRKVLVVDDNVDAAVSLADVLELGGHEVVVAHDGPRAVQAARVHAPEVILCDIGLPGASGYDVARAVRAVPALARALLVAVTGYGSEQDVARAREAGFDLHLTKPVDPQRILELLAASPVTTGAGARGA